MGTLDSMSYFYQVRKSLPVLLALSLGHPAGGYEELEALYQVAVFLESEAVFF